MNDLAALDLNLLVVMEALFAERHVSRAALRLNKSQPAVSQALGRLRQTFDDPLLIRGAEGWELTARAREMEPVLVETLAAVRGLVRSTSFDPAQTQRTYRLTMSDYASAMLAPRLLPVLRAQAPGVRLSITTRSRDAAMAAVVDGEVDLALGVFPERPAQVRESLLLEERFVCVMDRTTLSAGFDLAAYLARPHVCVAVQDGRVDEVDGALAQLGRKRDVIVTLPHWSVAPDLIAGTDLVLTISSRSLREPLDPRLAVVPPPFALSSFPFVQTWHARRDGDAGLRWLRERLIESAAEV
ncbi:MAG: LysR family transcriptional regulator [Alphaproteobacteria bacterium]|nr:MAG: LysR family transcriptional regulator [Alphaproteobacteria bacterium]